MNFLEKIRALPEAKRKIILWTIMVAVAALLLFFYIKTVKQKMADLSGENVKKSLNLPDIKKELDDKLPRFEISESELSGVLQEIASTTGTGNATDSWAVFKDATGTKSEATSTEQNSVENQ